MDTISQSLSHLLQAPYVYFAGIVFSLLIVLYLVHNYRRGNRAIVPFKTQGGTIEISPQTLRAVVQIAVASVPGIERATCSHFPRGQGVGLRLSIHLRANHSLREIENRVKRRIRATLLEQFGMEAVEPIHIRVNRIVGDPRTAGDDGYTELNGDADAEIDAQSLRESDDDRPYADETRL